MLKSFICSSMASVEIINADEQPAVTTTAKTKVAAVA